MRRLTHASLISLAAPAVVALLPSCGIVPGTGALVESFNSGVIDSDREIRTREEVGRELVAEVLKDALADGYFGQGERSTSRDPEARHDVAAWAEAVRAHAADVAELVVALRKAATYEQGDAPELDPWHTQSGPERRKAECERRFVEDLDGWLRSLPGQAPPAGPVCTPDGLEHAPAAYHIDRNRFTGALLRAAQKLAEIHDEGLVDGEVLRRGIELGLAETEAYLRTRRWARSFSRPVTGIVVKGGASTGFYSAGVTWVVLNVLDRCLRDRTCRERSGDPRLTLLSGTSTGATVVAVVDLFNAEWDTPGHATRTSATRALQLLATWYTHRASRDLYCVRDAPVTALLQDQKGLVEFDGVRALLRSHLSDATKGNGSELILNAVDFQSGRLLAVSDQDPSVVQGPEDVAIAVEASFVLPFIARPVPQMRIHGRMVPGTFLDGGIRSEIPLLPLARRGAERALVVSSAASVVSGTKPMHNAVEIAARYINVSTGGITESELSHARRFAESVRAQEIERCTADRAIDALFEGAAACSAGAARDRARRLLCEARWRDVCPGSAAATAPATAPAPASATATAAESASAPAPAPEPAAAPAPLTADGAGHTSALWQVKGIFRDEWRTDAASGYDFDPAKVTPLFFAGMEAARVRCAELARFLGVVAGKDALLRWCSELPTYLPEESSKEGEDLRSCAGAP